MNLSELIRSAPGVSLERVASRDGGAEGDPVITMVTDDSRRVRPGALFVARPGSGGNGADFITDAISRGAAAIVALPGAAAAAPGSVRRFACDAPARALAHLAHAHAGWPSRSLDVVAVTGTNGKTTVATLVRQIHGAAGVRCGVIGTIEVHDGVSSVPASLTTPGAESLAGAFAAMRANGCRAAAMEASSHALDQERMTGVDVRVGIFTNLTGDHLDYHRTMDDYAAAKAKLFESLEPGATAVVNATDPAHERMIRTCRARIVRCGIAPEAPRGAGEAGAEIHASGWFGSDVTFRGPWGAFRATLPLAGRHNVMNALEAVAAVAALGLDAARIERAIASLRAPPGRLEPVTSSDAPFQVLVDYAHTDDALANVLAALRPMVPTGGRLIALFGCGGDRDPTKRPRMARAACRGADLVFVTSDNPRREDPEAIVDQIMAGVPAEDRPRVRREVDRAKAIRAAVAEARPGDVVVIAGKGHEDYQIIGTEKRHFDDREEARLALAEISGSATVAAPTAAGAER